VTERIFTVSKRRLLFLSKIILAVIVLLWVISKVHVEMILKSLREPASPAMIVFACLLLVPNVTLQWFRWHFLLRQLKPGASVQESLISLFGGLTVGLVTPGRIGEFGRTLFLSQVNHIKALGLVFIDKFYASVIMILFGVWGVISFLGSQIGYHRYLMAPLIGLGLVLTVVGLILMLRPVYVRSFFYHISLIFPFRDKMKSFIDGLDLFPGNRTIYFILLSVSVYCIYIIQFSLLALAFENLSLNTLFTATTSTLFTKIVLPVSIGDLGIREGAAIYFFRHFGAQKVTAFNSAFLLFMINVMVPAIIGLFYIPRMDWREGSQTDA
jgi:uncharacterized protein (TIRG00374 family)